MEDLIERFAAADDANFKSALRALESIHRGARDTLESGATLLDELAQEFADHSSLREAQAAVNRWLDSVGGGGGELIKFLEQASLVGSGGAEDLVAKAKEGYKTAHACLARTWLFLRLRRDYLFGLGDLLRLRVTSAIGYLRLQSETVGLMVLFTEDEELACDWMNLGQGDGRKFYQRTQARLKAKLNSLNLKSYYEDGSEWALHSRALGLAGGIAAARDEGPGTVSLSYQEMSGDTEELFTWVWHYLNAHRLFTSALVSELPELKRTNVAAEKCTLFAQKLATWVERRREIERLKGQL